MDLEILPPRNGRCQVIPFPLHRRQRPAPATPSADVGTIEAELRELGRDWMAWHAERDRLDAEEAVNRAWAACLRRRELALSAAVPEGRE